MDIGLIVSFAGVVIAALAGVLGVWMERDPGSPRTWGLVFSGLIVVASVVEAGNTLTSTEEAAATDAKLATVLEAMTDLAAKGDNPALEQFVGAELAVQARANPEVVKKMEQNIAAKGGDPAVVTRKASEGRRLAAGLPAKKPAAGERPVLGARSGGVAGSAARAGKAGKAGGVAGARAPTGLGLSGGQAAPAGAAARLGKAGKAGSAAAADASAAAGAAAGAAGSTMRAARSTGAQATDEAKAAAGEAATSADKAKESAEKAAESADKAKDDAKKKGNQAADAVRGLGS